MTTAAIGYELDSLIDEPRTVARRGHWLAAAQILLLSLLFGAPLAFGGVLPLAWGAITALACIALFCWALACVRSRCATVATSGLHFVTLALLAIGLAQIIAHVTVDAIATRDALLMLVTDGLILFLASTLFANANEESHERLGDSIAIYAFGMSLFAIIQSLSNSAQIYWLITPRWGGYIFGPYVNHNHYAGLMEMLLPLMLAFLLYRGFHNPLSRLLGFAVLIVFLSVVLSGSRSGLISVLAELLIFAIILLARSHNRRRLVCAASIALCAAGLLYSWLVTDSIADRLRFAVSSPEASYGERRNMALDALSIMRHFPVTGSGLGTFATAYPQYQSFATDQQIDHAHNDYAELLAETGIPGAILLFTALGIFFVHAWRTFAGPLQSVSDWLRLGATIGCCGILIHSFTDFNLHIPANAAWFAVCVGIASSRAETQKRQLSASTGFTTTN